MMRLVLLAATCACASSSPTPAPSNSAPREQTQTGLPADVKTLTERWEQCWHFAGEEPYDAQRKKEIEQGIATWCNGNEEQRERLRTKYRDRADVRSALKKLDEMQ